MIFIFNKIYKICIFRTDTTMLSDEAFQKLLFDLFCLWHDVQRHYDPPITHNEEEKMKKVSVNFIKIYFN